MSGARYIATALTLGGAVVAMTVLSATPGEAKRAHFKKGAFVGSKAWSGPTKAPRVSRRRTGDPTPTTDPRSPKDPGIGKLPPLSSSSYPIKVSTVVKAVPGTPPSKLPPIGSSEPTPIKAPTAVKDVPGTQPSKLPPIASSEPSPIKAPDVVKGGPHITYPPSDGPTPFPRPSSSIEAPSVLQWDPGTSAPPPTKSPPTTTPGSPAPGGGGWAPTYVPGRVVVVGGGDARLPSLPKDQVDGPVVVAESGGPSCDPCEWLKANHVRTGLTRWLDRYRQCLIWKRGDN